MPDQRTQNQATKSLRRGPILSALRVLGILTALFLIWSMLRLEPWNRPPERVDASASSVPWTAVNPIGVNTFLAREVEPWKRERTLEMASDAGVGWIKEHFAWRAIETAPDTYWDSVFQQDAWAKYDAIVDNAERQNLRIIARIDLAPPWARPIGSEHTAPPTNYADFADFISEFVRHYEGRVQFIQIWNEPNLAAEWGGQIDPEGYAELLRVAAIAARGVDPNVVILSAPLAMTTENSGRAMDDLSFWQALYDAGAAPYFDIMSANAYGLDNRYDAAPDPNRLNIRRIELLRDIAVRNDDGGKAIWLNEYGWNASPEDFDPDLLTWSRVAETDQADWTAQGIEYLRDRFAWFGVANTWYFRQVGDIPSSRSDYYFRAVDVEFTPRPLYVKLSEYGNAKRFAGPGIHNDLSPAVRSGGDWRVVKSADSIGDEYISGGPGATLAINVEGNQLSALLASDQPATELLVTDENGNTYRTAIVAGQREVQLRAWSVDQAPQRREIRIEVIGSEPLLLDGLNVRENRSSRTLVAGSATLLTLLLTIFIVRRSLPA